MRSIPGQGIQIPRANGLAKKEWVQGISTEPQRCPWDRALKWGRSIQYGTDLLNNKNQPLLEVYSWLKMILCNPQKPEQTLFGLDLGILAGIKAAEVVGTGGKGPRICQLSSLWMNIAPWEQTFFDSPLSFEYPLTSTRLRSHKGSSLLAPSQHSLCRQSWWMGTRGQIRLKYQDSTWKKRDWDWILFHIVWYEWSSLWKLRWFQQRSTGRKEP